MKRILLLSLSCLCALFVKAQGIAFQHCSWAEAIVKAKAEQKLIFVDFYTQWCGPCYNMAHQVFTLPTVGDFYNSSFVNMKIDAEHGEGIELAKKYGVNKYPTYLFIDPVTGDCVHRSSSRQEPEQFIFTGRSALTDTLRSCYLENKYQSGCRERSFLIDYINYEHSIYERDKVAVAFDELMSAGALLSDADVWNVFVNCITGMDNAYLKQVSDNYPTFCNIFGKTVVDAKLVKETRYGDIDKIMALCDFSGKKLNCELIRANRYLRAKDYVSTIALIDSLIAAPDVDKQQLIASLKYIARLSYQNDIPDEWFCKCVEYLRYIAYNQSERDDAYIHQEYAAALESLLGKINGGMALPQSLLLPPAYGKKSYSMRPDDLKMKPRRK